MYATENWKLLPLKLYMCALLSAVREQRLRLSRAVIGIFVYSFSVKNVSAVITFHSCNFILWCGGFKKYQIKWFQHYSAFLLYTYGIWELDILLLRVKKGKVMEYWNFQVNKLNLLWDTQDMADAQKYFYK